MKYSAETYANAFIEVLESGGKQSEKSIIKRFASLIRKNGDLANCGKIFFEIEKLSARKQGGKFISVEVARDGETAAKISSLFPKKDAVKVRAAPELLAGARVLINHELELDFSFKRRLKDLFSK